MKAFDLGFLAPEGSRVLGRGWEAGHGSSRHGSGVETESLYLEATTTSQR